MNVNMKKYQYAVSAPSLLHDANVRMMFPPDVIARAKHFNFLNSGGLGAYSVSRGLPRVREEATDVFVVKANPAQGYYLSISYLSDQELIFLTNGASRGVKQILNCAIHGEGDRVMLCPKKF
ncbi:hypothetical protein Bca4012_088747 [Brassica carinata]